MSTCLRVFADKHQIKACKEKINKAHSSIDLLSNAFNLAGNEVRLNILFLLYDEPRLCVCDLSDILDMKVSAVSQHLRKLKDKKIIESRKEEQLIFYSFSENYKELFSGLFDRISINEILKKVG